MNTLVSQCCRIKLFSVAIKLKGRWTRSLVCIAGNVIVDVGTVLGVMPALEEALFIAIAGTRTKPF